MARSAVGSGLVGVGRFEGRALASALPRAGWVMPVSMRCSTQVRRSRQCAGRSPCSRGSSDRPSVNDGDARAGHRLEGGREVGVAGEARDVRARAHAGSAHDERHVDVGLVRRLLAGRHAVLTEVEPVVGREHDVRVVELLRRPQRVHETRHATVDGLQGADPPAVEHVDGVRLDRTRTAGGRARTPVNGSRRPGRSSASAARRACGNRRRSCGAGVAGWCGAYTDEVGEERAVLAGCAADEVVGEAHVHVGPVVARAGGDARGTSGPGSARSRTPSTDCRRPRSPSGPSPAARRRAGRRWDSR